MTNAKTLADTVIKKVEGISQVPVCHAPSAHAGEKIIYRYNLGEYDGIFECVTVTMKFISKELERAFLLADTVSNRICTLGDRDVGESGADALFISREDGGGSGYIGRTGHYYVSARFQIKRRVQQTENVVKVTLD